MGTTTGDEQGIEKTLELAWRRMRVSVRCSGRLPTWDAILITAASPQQAELYQIQLQRAMERGRISPQTIALAVPDPHGKRIGSGGATLSAIRQLRAALGIHQEALAGKRVLLVHAGGDSKRVPWANAIGKAFIPFPFSSSFACADEPVPLLFDHILAISSLAVARLSDRGGLFIMTGDVLPCFDATRLTFPEDGAVVVTTPTSLDVAANHGVILACSTRVDDLLQKPSIEQMHARGAVGPDSRALLDTGIFLVTGKGWHQLIQLSSANPDPVQILLENSEEMSLYEEIAGAWVAARHEWLKTRPLGKILIEALGTQQLYQYCASDLKFLHFGTSGEILQHMATLGVSARRHFSYTCDDEDSVASTSVLLDSALNPGSKVGEGSLVFHSTLATRLRAGSWCVVLNIHDNEEMNLEEVSLPDKHCLWQVPLKKTSGRVVFCCSIEDNPKLDAQQGGTFCGKTWGWVFEALQVVEKSELWEHENSNQDLWSAKMFPVVTSEREGVRMAAFLMGINRDAELLRQWRAARRVSLAEVQELTDFETLNSELRLHHCKLARKFARTSIEDELMNRDFSALARDMKEASCREVLSLIEAEAAVPASRKAQARADLLHLCGDHPGAGVHQQIALQAVVAETSDAVCCGENASLTGNRSLLLRLQPSRSASVSLPVRIDLAGGWSDTPPWSIERRGRVLNMAVSLNDQTPVGAEVLLSKTPGISISSDDDSSSCWVEDPKSLSPPFDASDPFRLVKAALIVTGWTDPSLERSTRCSWGLQIRTWSSVPRGSGLGTSSILAAAVIRALLEVSDGDGSNENVARLVLVQEQLMGTGGGWQDQVGGIYPGLKCTSSFPGKPISFFVQPIHLAPEVLEELQERMLLVFTGQVRLANQVLQKVVTRYLQRDTVLIASIERLVELAKVGEAAFVRGELERVGEIMEEAWGIHQELDPFCSNEFVDSVFGRIREWSCGFKLAGAGGGGFAIILARSRECAATIKRVLTAEFGHSLQFFSWRLHL